MKTFNKFTVGAVLTVLVFLTAPAQASCEAAQEQAGREIQEQMSEVSQSDQSVCSAFRDTIKIGRLLESVISACSGVWSAAEIQAQREQAQEYIRIGKQGLREACGG